MKIAGWMLDDWQIVMGASTGLVLSDDGCSDECQLLNDVAPCW